MSVGIGGSFQKCQSTLLGRTLVFDIFIWKASWSLYGVSGYKHVMFINFCITRLFNLPMNRKSKRVKSGMFWTIFRLWANDNKKVNQVANHLTHKILPNYEGFVVVDLIVVCIHIPYHMFNVGILYWFLQWHHLKFWLGHNDVAVWCEGVKEHLVLIDDS